MAKNGSFNMKWLQDVLEIRPIFSCNEIYWSKSINEILADEAERNENAWALLVLDGLTDHFSGNWGCVSADTATKNNNVLRDYYGKNLKTDNQIISKFVDEGRAITIVTDGMFLETVVKTVDEA